MDTDPDPANVLPQLILLFALIGVNAFFAMSEMAIITLNDNKILRMAEQGHKKAKQVLRLTENSSNFLSTIQIGVTLAGFLTSASAAQGFAVMLTRVLDIPQITRIVPIGLIRGFSVVLITVITSFFSLVLGELVPKRIAMHKPEPVSFFTAGILLFVAKALRPFVKVLSFSTNLLVRLFGIDPNANLEEVTEEEIRMMVDVGGERGVIESSQKEMIDNIFEFDDMNASDIMTHRTDMIAVEADDDTLADVVNLSMEYGYSRIPVFDDDPDNIIGIAYVKDLLPYVGKELPQSESIRNHMRKAYYVPDSKDLGELFQEMNENRIQMAVVVDEFGGTAGIVTLEDLLESIVGNIQDEYDDEDEEISRIDETTFTVDGTTDVEEVQELVGTTLPEGDYDTLGGFIISLLGFLPKDGDLNELDYENLHFTILNVEERRIGKVKIEILPLAQTESKREKRKNKESTT